MKKSLWLISKAYFISKTHFMTINLPKASSIVVIEVWNGMKCLENHYCNRKDFNNLIICKWLDLFLLLQIETKCEFIFKDFNMSLSLCLSLCLSLSLFLSLSKFKLKWNCEFKFNYCRNLNSVTFLQRAMI